LIQEHVRGRFEEAVALLAWRCRTKTLPKTKSYGAAPVHAQSEVRRKKGGGNVVIDEKSPHGCGQHCEHCPVQGRLKFGDGQLVLALV
jgi:NAD-dependent dihydropyrimidine dehydrogenase PreA subunit